MARAIQTRNHYTEAEAFEQVLQLLDPLRPFSHTRWRHGVGCSGWFAS